MVVTSSKGTSGTSVIKTDYPVVQGTSLGTTKIDGVDAALQPEQSTLIPEKHWGSI